MKQSFSRAALIQWFALAVDWKGFVTWTQTHFTFPSSRSRIIWVRWLPTLGLSVLAGSPPAVLAVGAVLGVVHLHVGREPVREGADLARRCRRPRAGR